MQLCRSLSSPPRPRSSTNVSVRQAAAKVARSGGLRPSLGDLSITELPHRSRQQAHPPRPEPEEEELQLISDRLRLPVRNQLQLGSSLGGGPGPGWLVTSGGDQILGWFMRAEGSGF